MNQKEQKTASFERPAGGADYVDQAAELMAVSSRHARRMLAAYQDRGARPLSRVNYICRLASISFAGSPPRPLLGRIGAVAGDVKLQDDGVVHDPVNRRGGGHGVGKDAFPLREDQV